VSYTVEPGDRGSTVILILKSATTAYM